MKYAYLSETVGIKKVSETKTEGVFEVEGLYAGYGITIGNSLRRVLFSSLPNFHLLFDQIPLVLMVKK